MSALFAATHPERTLALVLYGAFARAGASMISNQEFEESLREIEDGWPDSIDPAVPAPSLSGDEGYRQWWRAFLRHAASPGAAVALHRMNSQIDVCAVLPAIHVPTLVLYRKDARFGHGAAAWRATGDDLMTPADEAAVIGARVVGSRVMELPGGDHLPWVGDADSVLGEVEEFLTGVRRGPETNRVLATILFTDIIESTQTAARVGDERWRDLVERHNAVVRRQLERFGGREIDTARRRVPGVLRRAGDGHSLRPRNRRFGDGARARDPGRTAHRRVRADRREARGHRGPHRRASRGAREPRRGPRLGDGQGPRGRVTHVVSRPRVHALKGVPGEWRVFAVEESTQV